MNNEEIKMEVEGKEKKKRNITSIICVIIGVVCIGVAAVGLYGVYKDYKVGDDIYNDVEEEFVQIHIPGGDVTNDTTQTDGNSEGSAVPKGPWYELASVDVAGLKNRYPDVVGWILFEDGSISYPVVHSNSNDTYLYTTYNGVESIGGSIFVEAVHKSDFSETHTLVYGHNMKNGSMFGKLHKYRQSKDYYENHKYFQIFRENEILRYEIFAYQQASIESFVYKEYFTSGKELGEKLLQNSMVKPDVVIEDDDKIVTLSTCISSDDYRFVVSAVLVERYDLENKTLIEE